ncbi:MAG: hypothetical protein WBW48_00270 [Anaerolineae bacterium]
MGQEDLRGYEDTAIYQLGKRLAVEIHRMTLDELPKFEMYEEGSPDSPFTQVHRL